MKVKRFLKAFINQWYVKNHRIRILKKKYTKRGFQIYAEFIDLYGTRVVIQQSSLARKHAVWIQHDNPEDGKTDIVGMEGKPFVMTPHLSVGQAKKVIKALQEFIENE